MDNNLALYNKLRSVPSEAQKQIAGGRLKGMTDINPMWRIKALTDAFGPCGIGWKYEITNKALSAGAKDEVAAFVDINLYIKVDGEWSEAIPGTGGSLFVASERNGLYTSDECYKMALTDAISVACKALGVGADVYWDKDRSKYDRQTEQAKPTPTCADCGKAIIGIKRGDSTIPPDAIAAQTTEKYGRALCLSCAKAANGQNQVFG